MALEFVHGGSLSGKLNGEPVAHFQPGVPCRWRLLQYRQGIGHRDGLQTAITAAPLANALRAQKFRSHPLLVSCTNNNQTEAESMLTLLWKRLCVGCLLLALVGCSGGGTYEEGYNAGYHRGRARATKGGPKVYTRDKSEEYKKGFLEGWNVGLQESPYDKKTRKEPGRRER